LDLRLDRLTRFTDSPEFPKALEEYIAFLGRKIPEQIEEYPQGDMATMGLPGRVTDVLRKAWRLWSFVIKDRRGKGDFEDELNDLVAYTAYLWCYYYMMKGGIPRSEFKRYAKYEVMKLDDIDKFLSDAQKRALEDVSRTIQEGRVREGKPACNRYVVVNEDMPYAEQVWKLIEEGEKE